MPKILHVRMVFVNFKCLYKRAWTDNPCDVDCNQSYCDYHLQRKCKCGSQATHDCSEFSGSFICGYPICENRKCEHYH